MHKYAERLLAVLHIFSIELDQSYLAHIKAIGPCQGVLHISMINQHDDIHKA